MSSEVEKNPVVLSELDRGTMRRMFTRKVDIETNIIKLNDETETRQFLKEFREHEENQKRIQESVKGFNPDNDVVVSKSQLDITNQLKAFANIANKVDELHTIQTGKLYKAPAKKLSKKQIEKAELLQLRQNAHRRMLNQ